MSINVWNRNLQPLLGRLTWGGIIVWTTLVAASLGWNLYQARQTTLEMALTAAQLSYSKDLAHRLWAANHGGVYVPATPLSPPNPYLSHLEERDITTPSGRSLTLVNPAYMIRQVHELATQLYGIRGHLTSLKPLRPENAPDAWEAKALAAFEAGAPEVKEVVELAGEPHMRLMRPWRTEKSCLKCHGAQGYQEGDIRGGISIDVPLKSYFAGIRNQALPLAAGHGLIWMLGVAGIFLGERLIKRHLDEREQAALAIRENREDLNRAQAVAHTGSWRLDVQRDEIRLSDETHRILGISPGTRLPYEAFLAIVHPEDRDYVDRQWTKALRGEPYDIEHRIVVGETVKWVREQAELEFDAQGLPLGGVGVTQDISARKRAEETIKASLQEKEVLLKEIHHRTKNNLHVVCALLNLQSSSFEDPQLQQVFQYAENRIRSMALVHEKLYQSKSLSHIDLKDYIDDLAHFLLRDLENTELPFIMFSYCKGGGTAYENIDFGSEWDINRYGGLDFAFG